MQLVTELSCRTYRPTDLEPILHLFYNTVHSINIKDYSQAQINMWASSVSDKEKWAKSLLKLFAYVVENDGKIVGFADMTHSGSLEHLYVDKDFQGCGVASLLLKAIEQKACELGFSEIITESSITAKPFFEKRGFVVIKEQEKIVSGVLFITYMMQKSMT